MYLGIFLDMCASDTIQCNSIWTSNHAEDLCNLLCLECECVPPSCGDGTNEDTHTHPDRDRTDTGVFVVDNFTFITTDF